MPVGTLKDAKVENKTVLLRLDLNSPIDPATGRILDDKRFREHLPTIKALSGSRVVIVTHQSRPGKKDFTTLEGHAERLGTLLQQNVEYIDDIFGKCAREAVRRMKNGDVLMLENVRFNAEENLTVKPEEAKKTHLVQRLSRMGDIFVNDAFGTAHRSQPTMVGLPMVMRSVAGLLMEKEITYLGRIFGSAPGPVCMVLGGTKVDDSLSVAEHVLEKGIADTVIVTGVVANVFLLAAGHAIGKGSLQLVQQLGYEGEVERARRLLASYRERIAFPETVAVREEGRRVEYPVDAIPGDATILDVGVDAIASLAEKIRSCRTVVFNGPAGVFEDPDFATGTYELLRAASRSEFSIIGGGHTAAVAEKMGIDRDFSHISTGGGACIEFLTGKKLPAVEALERSREIFG
ncbi:MAG: phosphoglycerate kinase [Methanolinea sp.]|nr:phosphoglycerate kinase [Methanolinea sp.]